MPPRQRGVQDVSAVQLRDREQVEHSHEHPHPPGERERAEQQRGCAAVDEPPQRQGDERVAEPGGIAADREQHTGQLAVPWEWLAVREADPQHRERDREPGEGTGHAHVEQLAPVGGHRAQANERTHRADERRPEWHRNEVRW